MYTLGTHFDELLKNIRPPQNRLEAAQTLPDLVRQYLEDNNEFATISPHSILAGSYGQHMCVGDVKDVDFLVRVPGNPEANDPPAKELIQNLKQALDGLPEYLGFEGHAELQDLEVERARRSVHVCFVEHDFHLDVVPCIAPNGLREVLYVPDRGFNEWIESHPIGYIDLLKDLDQDYGGKVRNLGKLFKHFRNVQMKNRRPKSYWLGALMIDHIRRENGLDMSQPLAIVFRDLLRAIYKQYDHLLCTSATATPNIPDPMLGHNISWNWERTHFETFMRRIDDGVKWATTALDSDTDRETAISYWQKIFGDEYFPAVVDEAAARAAQAGMPGSAYVSASGLILATQPASGVYTPSQHTTFHGQADE